MANYVVKTDSTHSKWWFINAGSGSRLSDLMDDQPDGPYYDVASAWTQSGGDAAEYYHAPTKRPDNVYVSGVKLTETADDTCIDGGGGGLADGEWCWETANSRVYVQVAAGSPGANADFYYDWVNSISGTNFMTEHSVDKLYQIHLSLDIGDNSTSTTLLSFNESVFFDTNAGFTVKTSATLTLGVSDSGRGSEGADWFVSSYTSNQTIYHDGTIYLYGSYLKIGYYQRHVFRYKLYVYDSIISGGRIAGQAGGSYANLYYQTSGTGEETIISNSKIIDFSINYVQCSGEQFQFTNSIALGCEYALEVNLTSATIIVNGFDGANNFRDFHVGGTNNIIEAHDSKKQIVSDNVLCDSSGTFKLYYTVSIHIADKDGNDLSDVNVAWADSQSHSGSDTTDDNGDVSLTLQTAQKYYQTWTDYNDFTFTISKTGYETLTLENITIDSPIDWHLELQDPHPVIGETLIDLDGHLYELLEENLLGEL